MTSWNRGVGIWWTRGGFSRRRSKKRRAEQDKLAAITALEARSREFMKEKQDKLKLEERIKQLEGQLLIGGRKLEDTPAFRSLVAAEHVRIRTDYERRLKNLERERLSVEEDKAQVDRYKQLLLKQRDIMIALTARLNERDEQIVSLQEELEAYDRAQRKLEDQLDSKSADLIALRKAAMEHNAKSPVQNRQLAGALGAWGNDAYPDMVEGGPLPHGRQVDSIGSVLNDPSTPFSFRRG